MENETHISNIQINISAEFCTFNRKLNEVDLSRRGIFFGLAPSNSSTCPSIIIPSSGVALEATHHTTFFLQEICLNPKQAKLSRTACRLESSPGGVGIPRYDERD